MCFQRGFSATLFSKSDRCSSPLIKRFLPVSPEYLDGMVCSQILQEISYPTPVLLQTPSCPELHGKHLGLRQCFLLLAPGTVMPSTCPSCLPPLSWTLSAIFEPFNSSSQTFLRALARASSGVGGMMSAPSLILVPRGSRLYQRFLFSSFLIRLPFSS